MFRNHLILLAILFLAVNTTILTGQPVRRHILALYNSDAGQKPNKNHIHKNAEVILNYLGCVLDYWDVSEGLPGAKRMQKYLGVLGWFHDYTWKDPEQFIQWGVQQIEQGRKVVIFGSMNSLRKQGANQPVDIGVVNRLANKIGFVVRDDSWTNEAAQIDLVYKDVLMVEFERDLLMELSEYEGYQSTNPQNKVYLKIKRTDIANSESDMIFTTPVGGFAHPAYILYQNPLNFQSKWRLNPFLFFTEAFDLDDLPKFDVTTLNGLRIWTSHIDGDALISKTEVAPYTYCGEAFREEIIKKYKWPISASIVVAEVHRSKEFVAMARSLFVYDWVEAGSHSYSHPFYWADDYEEKDNYAARNLKVDGYEFNIKQEVVGSVNYINKNLLPPGKRVRAFYWSGNCLPTAEAIAFCDQLNIGNINGEDTLFDTGHKSYTGVAPLGTLVNGHRQIYAPNSNENVYTNHWHGPFYGFKYVLETFANTESPIRIKPINIYYHYYSAEKLAALNALTEVMEKTTSQDVAPMFISEYIDMVYGFFNAQIKRVGRNSWDISNFGSCTTIRFDDEKLFPDFKKSEGVLGFTHFQSSLYLHLEKRSRARIVLTDREPTETYIAQASHRISNWRANNSSVSFKTSGFGNSLFAIANLRPLQNYTVSIRGKTLDSFQQKSDAVGNLKIKRPLAGTIDVGITMVK